MRVVRVKNSGALPHKKIPLQNINWTPTNRNKTVYIIRKSLCAQFTKYVKVSRPAQKKKESCTHVQIL